MFQVAQEGAAKPQSTAQGDWQPTIVALVCNWCTYTGADMAGTTRRAYPATVRVVRVPCTGRIDPLLIMKAFEQGADGVVVSGCHPGDCHYVQGNMFARRRFTAFRTLMGFLGLDQRRLQFAWVSASEGVKWAQLVEEVSQAVHEAGPFREWGRLEAGHASTAELPPMPAAPRAAASAAEQQAIGQHLQTLAATLLQEKKVSVVIGYTRGSLPDQMVPVFVTKPEEVSALGWSDRCVNDLAVYLPMARRQWDTVGIIVKKCDARAVTGLLQENQIPRDKVVVIGVSCPGVQDGGTLAAKCYACDGEAPALVDWTVLPDGVKEKAVPSTAKRAVAPDPRDAQIAYLESLSPGERWAYWQSQFEACVRCYGCRAVCPLCYCAVCVAEKNRPQWIPTSIDGKGNLAWNINRALHLAGRCGGCDECARVCPADVRLDLINHRLATEMEKRFGYVSGDDPTIAPPLACFRPDDPQEFIR